MSLNTTGLLLAMCCCLGQSQTPTPSFEVADVKGNASGEARMAVDMQAGGRLSAHNVPLRILIALAYHVRPDSVTEGPGWLSSARYDIVAKASQTAGQDELRRMLQSLLAERFKLVVHQGEKIMPAYALEVGKNGAKLQEAGSAVLSESRCVPGEGVAGQKHTVCRHMTMALLADTLPETAPRDLDVPVLDRTGLAGKFDFKLDWTPAAPSAAPSGTPPAEDPLAGPTLFEAVETQLGLRLQRTRLPLPVIVVDTVERVPSGN